MDEQLVDTNEDELWEIVNRHWKSTKGWKRNLTPAQKVGMTQSAVQLLILDRLERIVDLLEGIKD